MVRFQSVRVATGVEEEGVLAFLDDRLLAVLVRLADNNPIAPKCWYLEAGFGLLLGQHPTFIDLEAAATELARMSDP
jgi:hypothetical protein